MAHSELKNYCQSKGKRKDHKMGKKIGKKSKLEQTKKNKRAVAHEGKRNYSPTYHVEEKYTPLFYSDEYKPSLESSV